MKNNLWDGKIIEPNDIHNLCLEFSWLTQICLVCFLNKLYLSISSFKIKLI